MANFNRFIDPKTKQPLVYEPEKSVLTTEDRKISYPVINGIPRFVSSEFYQEVVKDEVMSWFEEAGFINLKCIQLPGWEHTGYFVSGRMSE